MPSTRANDLGQVWPRLTMRAWHDEAFRKRLLADPIAVLKEEGITLAPSLEIKVHEDTDQVMNLILPRKTPDEVPEAELDKVAAAGCRPVIDTDL